MKLNRRTFLKSSALALAAAGAPLTTALAQGSGKSISLLVPWPAGGPVDITARALQPELSRLADAQVLIENVPGAGGVIGLNRYAQRAPAERGLVMVSVSDVITSLLATPGQKIKPEDFQLLGLTAAGGSVLVIRDGLPARNFDELVRLARSQAPQSLTFGHFGPGSFFHLVWEELTARTGITALQVPYKGTPDILRDLSTGDLDVAFLPLNATVMGFPRLRGIAMTAATRNPYYPDLPTLAESSSAAGYAAWGWYAMATMRDTASAELDRLERWTRSAVASDTAAAAYKAQSAVVPPAQSRIAVSRFFAAEIERYRAQLNRLGLLAHPA
jgi:tripartite-type tricarboxylate transporter receptor subunit TctC